MKKTEHIIGFILILLILLFAQSFLGSQALYVRLLIGIGFGYALTRGFMGFAGSVNRAYRTGSTQLIRVLMWMFLGTAILSVPFLFTTGAENYRLSINAINWGLLLGGLSFGFGMTFSSCCATGVLTDLVTGLPRAAFTLLFFGIGVFVGFPVQKSQGWIKNSILTSDVGEKLGTKGVFLPDLFKWDGLNGYLGAVITTALFAVIVVLIAYKYENRKKEEGKFEGVESEIEQERLLKTESKSTFKLFSQETYYLLFIKPWSMKTGATVITILFTLLMVVSKRGWGASTVYGLWFGRLLKAIGMPIETIVEFTGKPAKFFNMPFFSHPVYTQNIGIILGTLICLLIAGSFTKTFTSELKITPKAALVFSMGGFFMGIGTRLSNGCNVGALYTPIANFSLSGWIFLVFLILGGILGNKVAHFSKKNCKNSPF